MRGGQAGRQRERQVAEKLRGEGYVVLKGTTYGCCDLAAFRAGDVPMLIEVKSTAGGPYERFGPTDREVLALEAERGGARAVLAYWPPRKQMRLIPSTEWPPHPDFPTLAEARAEHARAIIERQDTAT